MADGDTGERIRRCRPLLGTFVEIAVRGGDEAAIARAFAAIAHVHARMSFHEETSDLAALRRAEPGHAIALDPDTVAVLALARQLYARSGGLFDVAIGARLVAADFLPRPAGIDLRRMTGTTDDILLLDARHVACRRPMLIDLGGIAKGYAVDRAIDSLARDGVRHAIVNAGGDLRVIGSETVHLRGADGAIALTDSALASSSNRHLRRRHCGRETAPHRGRARNAVLADAAVTIVAPSCAIADAMTKIAMASPALADAMLADLGGAVVVRAIPARRAA